MSASTTHGLFPEVETAVDEWVDGQRRILGIWPEIQPRIEAMIEADKPHERRQTLYFRVWRTQWDHLESSHNDTLEALAAEARRPPGGPTHPRLELMIAAELSDRWQMRGEHERALAHAADACRRADEIDVPSIASNERARLGFVLTMAGFVDSGIGLITRAVARHLDVVTLEYVGEGWTARPEWGSVEELADAYEHSRNHRRALAAYETVFSMLGPGSTYNRTFARWSLVRCLAALGRAEPAAEIMLHAPIEHRAPPHLNTLVKYTRAATLLEFSRGDGALGLEMCATAAAQVTGVTHRELRRELLLDGTLVARRIDEPYWVIDQLADWEFGDGEAISLMSTLAAQDLAWAHRRVGNTEQARRFAAIAHIGSRRFPQRPRSVEFLDDELPGALLNVREHRNRIERARQFDGRSLRQAVDTVVHDVRDQLTSLQLMTEVGAGSQRRLWSVVDAFDTLLEDLIRGVEADRQLRHRILDLSALIDEVLTMFANLAAKKKIALESLITTGLKCRGDAAGLTRIVSNLVSNAIKYSPCGGTVQILTQSVDGDAIDLHVIDSGPGISADEADEIFSWGGIGSAEPTGGEPQHGIGLYAAQRLARLMGTIVRARPRAKDQPSVFSIRLPRSHADQPIPFAVNDRVTFAEHQPEQR